MEMTVRDGYEFMVGFTRQIAGVSTWAQNTKLSRLIVIKYRGVINGYA